MHGYMQAKVKTFFNYTIKGKNEEPYISTCRIAYALIIVWRPFQAAFA